jgi:ribulose-5-phosphate 4-epimerase/fuculose-1-phosphate aldolase
VPGQHGAFLINPYGMMYEEITASCLIKIDLAGTILVQARLRGARLRHQQAPAT